jgi:lipoprotein-anchoring transpeptidase ErfK/SrfK
MKKIPLMPWMLMVASGVLAASGACDAAEKSPGKKAAGGKAAFDEKALTLQVWLDRQDLGPGKIDAKGGEFTSKALALYNEMHPDAKVQDAAPGEFQEPPVIEYQVRDEDFQFVGELPKEKKEQAELKKLPYASIVDMVAERFHADPDLLATLNAGVDLKALKAGDVVKVPNVPPFEIEKLKEAGTTKAPADAPPRSLEISTDESLLRVLENGKLIAAFPVTVGSERLPAPKGSWKVKVIASLPDFRWDEKMLKEGERSDNAITLPPGPRNPVGVYWMGLNKDGIGVHGTDSPWTIGRSASHGCIRLANWDAVKVAGMIAPGVAVEIR